MWLADTPVALIKPTTPDLSLYFIHTDHLDTPRVISDTAQQPVWRWDNDDPFGANMANENPGGLGAFAFNLRFPGQYFDKETNLHYNIYRDYSPDIGRYIESDPIGLTGGLNTYTYVGGNPLSFVDPTGTTQCDVDSITQALQDTGLPQFRHHGFYTFGAVPAGKGAYTNKLQLQIVLPTDFLQCKNDAEIGGMVVTIGHEITHYNQNLFSYAITNIGERFGSESHNEEAYASVYQYGVTERALAIRKEKCRCECNKK